MTFDEWWHGMYGNDCMQPYEETMALQAWQAATLAERERCIKACVKWDGLRMNGVEEVIRRGEII